MAHQDIATHLLKNHTEVMFARAERDAFARLLAQAEIARAQTQEREDCLHSELRSILERWAQLRFALENEPGGPMGAQRGYLEALTHCSKRLQEVVDRNVSEEGI